MEKIGEWFIYCDLSAKCQNWMRKIKTRPRTPSSEMKFEAVYTQSTDVWCVQFMRWNVSKRKERKKEFFDSFSPRTKTTIWWNTNALSFSLTFYGVGLFICECIACWQTLFESKIDWHQKSKTRTLQWVSHRESKRKRMRVIEVSHQNNNTHTFWHLSEILALCIEKDRKKHLFLVEISSWNSVDGPQNAPHHNGSARRWRNWIGKICDIPTRWFAYWKFPTDERDSTSREIVWRHT